MEGEKIEATLLSRRPRQASLPVSVLSVMLMLFISLLQWRTSSNSPLVLGATAEALRAGEYWRLFTAIAAHADAGHLAINSIFFFIFSYLLYGYFGFWIYPLLTILLGALANYLSLLTYPSNITLLGASGVVYLMAGFWLTAFVLIERRFSLRRRMLRVTGFALLLLVPSSFQEQVSYRTHAIGCALGVLLALAYFMFRRKAIRAAEKRTPVKETDFALLDQVPADEPLRMEEP